MICQEIDSLKVEVATLAALIAPTPASETIVALTSTIEELQSRISIQKIEKETLRMELSKVCNCLLHGFV